MMNNPIVKMYIDREAFHRGESYDIGVRHERGIVYLQVGPDEHAMTGIDASKLSNALAEAAKTVLLGGA